MAKRRYGMDTAILRYLIPEREKERSEDDILELALRLRERMGFLFRYVPRQIWY